MKIGIHIGSAFSEQKTGVEEYAYQLIVNLAKLKDAKKHQFILYSNPKVNTQYPKLPENFKIKELVFPIFWTQIRLSLEILKDKPDVLFIPGNFVPLLKVKKTVVTIHGLEFKYYPKLYSFKNRFYLDLSTRRSVKKANKLIAVSENTKKDLVEIYKADKDKISVVHLAANISENAPQKKEGEKYILYIGRVEAKKNIEGILKAFECAKKKHNIPHKLVLAGGKGERFSYLQKIIEYSLEKKNIELLGYVSEEKKEKLLSDADIFLFPSFYEGFGIPILEAQKSEVPVITSNVSSMPEVAGGGALLVDPKNTEEIAGAIYKIYSDKNLRSDIIKKGTENAKKYSWEKCAEQTLKVVTSNK